MVKSISDPLPVGICRTVQFNNRYQRLRNWPEDRHPAFTAHIGIAGKSYSRNFRIDKFGEETAFTMAITWRREMEKRLKQFSPLRAKVGTADIRKHSTTHPAN
jgi:hypothetical protein